MKHPTAHLNCLFSSSIVLLCLLVPLASGFAQGDANLVGTWQSKDTNVPIVLILKSDGTGKLDNAGIKYVVEGNKLKVNEDGVVNNYTFSLRANTLTVSGGDLDQPLTFERQGTASAKGLGARRNQAGELAASSDLAGAWERRAGQEVFRLVLNSDGTGTLGDQSFKWTFNQGVLSLSGGGTTLMYNARVSGSSLNLSGGSPPQTVTFNRVQMGSGAAVRENEEAGSSSGGLIGRWQNREATVEIKDNGTVVINGETLRYTVQGNVITLTGSDGSARIPFQLDGDTLTTTFNGQRMVYTRASGNAGVGGGGGGSNPTELVGKWCYMSNVNANNGGRVSNRCFTLYANGTYEYYGETSSSGQYGSTASQDSDSGTWSVSGATITANSRKHGTLTYALEKRNHPKTGDPMLVLDGDAYVTFAPRRPW